MQIGKNPDVLQRSAVPGRQRAALGSSPPHPWYAYQEAHWAMPSPMRDGATQVNLTDETVLFIGDDARSPDTNDEPARRTLN
jgi:hypothetical protein